MDFISRTLWDRYYRVFFNCQQQAKVIKVHRWFMTQFRVHCAKEGANNGQTKKGSMCCTDLLGRVECRVEYFFCSEGWMCPMSLKINFGRPLILRKLPKSMYLHASNSCVFFQKYIGMMFLQCAKLHLHWVRDCFWPKVSQANNNDIRMLSVIHWKQTVGASFYPQNLPMPL